MNCGNLNEYDLHPPIRSSIIGDVALLREVCHWRVGFEAAEAQARPSSSFFLTTTTNLDVASQLLL